MYETKAQSRFELLAFSKKLLHRDERERERERERIPGDLLLFTVKVPDTV